MALIVKSKIKDLTKFNVAEEIYLELEKQLEEKVMKAEERAKANGRRTIFARDL